MASLIPRPVNRIRSRLRDIARAVGDTRNNVLNLRQAMEDRVADLSSSLERVSAENRELSSEVRALHAQGADLAERLSAAVSHAERDRGVLLEALRAVYMDDPSNRDRLWTARESAGYQEAYTDPEPLVSVVIATYTNHELLASRSIPSVLAQTYRNFEIQVVGDAAPDETGEVLRQFNDPRINYHNLTVRGFYPPDPRKLWLVAGTAPWNEAVRRARGKWIASLDDDDAFVPHHIEALLELARRDRLEMSYGKFRAHFATGSQTVGVFPPQLNAFALQASLYHADLHFFTCELGDAVFSLPGDWAVVERMLRAGVRFGMLDDVVVDYYPSRQGGG